MPFEELFPGVSTQRPPEKRNNRAKSEMSDLNLFFNRFRKEFSNHVDGHRDNEWLARFGDLELLINQVKNSLLLNTTSNLLAGVAAAADITLEFNAASIVSIEAFDATTRASVKLLDPASDFSHVAGSNLVTCDTDQSANILSVTYKRNSIP